MTDVLAENRELEKRLAYLEDCETESIKRGQRIGELGQRIVQAREILEQDGSWFSSREQFEDVIQRALEALEGK